MIGCCTSNAGCSHPTSAKTPAWMTWQLKVNHIQCRLFWMLTNKREHVWLFWAEFISKQTEYMSECARLRVCVLNESFGDGANEEPGDWKREIESGERREEGRRERTCSEYKNPSNSTVSRVKHTGWNYAHIPQLAFPKVPQLSWLVAKVLTCQSNQLLTLNEQNTSVGHLWPMWAE